MKDKSSETILVNFIKETVESKGCLLTEVDLENRVIKFDGPDEVVGACARAAAEALE